MVRLAVTGAAGRMGSRIIALAKDDQRFQIVAALERAGHPHIGQDAGEIAGTGRLALPIRETANSEFDVMIEFSHPAGSDHWLQYCLEKKRPILIGTTGHSPEQLNAVEVAARSIAVLKAANTSVGVNLMLKIVAEMAAALGDDYDIEITETHHRFKKDAPSGTAIALRDAIIKATGRNTETDVIYGRQGETGQRPPRQIGIHALRLGDTIGEHQVHFGSLGESLTLKHRAHTRDTFVKGALRAAAWLAGKPPGRYTMHDVL